MAAVAAICYVNRHKIGLKNMHWGDRREKFRAVLEGARCVYPASVYDPMMVDADHGYGNALNVKRTVEELETAGVCGLSIEDTALPPVYGSPEKPQVLSIEEGVFRRLSRSRPANR